MAIVISTQQMNLLEANRRAGYTNSVELLGDLVKKNDFLSMVPWYPTSDGSVHKYLEATKLGKGGIKKANAAVPVTSGQTKEETLNVFSYQADSPVDTLILKSATDKYKARDSEDALNLEGIVQGWIDTLLYATESADGVKGLYSILSGVSDRVISAGGTGSDLTSMLLFEFGTTGFNMRYPEGMTPGITSEDKGERYIPAPLGGGNYWAWVRHFEVTGIFECRRRMAMQRLCNIPAMDGLNISNLIRMKNKLPNVGRDACAYTNRTLHAEVEVAVLENTKTLNIQEIKDFGPVPVVAGIPFMLMEAILDTETKES